MKSNKYLVDKDEKLRTYKDKLKSFLIRNK